MYIRFFFETISGQNVKFDSIFIYAFITLVYIRKYTWCIDVLRKLVNDSPVPFPN